MPKRILEGTVISDKGDKSGVVLIERRFKHPRFKKVVKTTKRFMFHDEKNECKIGDEVAIQESRPISKKKRFQLLRIKGAKGTL